MRKREAVTIMENMNVNAQNTQNAAAATTAATLPVITDKTTLGELLAMLNLGEKPPVPTPRELFETLGAPIADTNDCVLFSNGFAARVFAGVLLSAILAAIMSTADSQLLVSASSFTNDIYRRVKKSASNHELVMISRLAVAAVALVAAFMSMNQESDFFKAVMKMVSFAWGGFGAAFGPLILLALFWRRVNLAGAVSGMVVGTVTCFVWKFVLSGYAADYPIFGLYELAPGFVLSFAVTVVVSLLTARPSAEMLAEFDRVDAEADRKQA